MTQKEVQKRFLIFDADDTLWENNIYFEAAFDRFCGFLAHSSLDPTEIRGILDEIEITNAKIHGYGSRSFARNLTACYERLAQRDISEADLAIVKDFAHAILEQPIQLLDGVEDTINALTERNALTIFTKGDPEEQQIKIDRSGLARYFEHSAIVKEKDERAYRALADARGFLPEHTWMIGNSPKSDIRPALDAGLNAVFVPHPRTWSLELAELPLSHPRMRTITNIRELAQIF